MQITDYLKQLPAKKILSTVKHKILIKLWGKDSDSFPKPWVSSADLLQLTGQKYFDRRTRELRDQLGCDIETSYREEFTGHAWRINSPTIAPPQDREYLNNNQKKNLFDNYSFKCATCGTETTAGIRGLQADHKVPISRGGSNDLINWQPLCNNCNVGKRRACAGCELNCNDCSWAFPEKLGIRTMLTLSESILRRVDLYISKTGESLDKVMEQAAASYLDDNKID